MDIDRSRHWREGRLLAVLAVVAGSAGGGSWVESYGWREGQW